MVILGLGSNTGDRQLHLQQAVDALAKLVTGIRVSHVYESSALLPANAPVEWDKSFLNMAVCGHTDYRPEALIAELHAIESRLGRTRRGHWAPREIDIDILAADDYVVKTPALTVPHPEMIHRDFVLIPMSEVAPKWRYPLAGEYHMKTAREIAADKGFGLGEGLRDLGMIVHA